MPFDPHADLGWNLLAFSKEHVTRGGIELPAWFDMEIDREGWPTKVVFSVVLDPAIGPIINGIRGGREYRHGYQDVIKFLRQYTDREDLLRYLTAYASAGLALERALDPSIVGVEPDENGMVAVGELIEGYAKRAWPATEVQRRRRITRQLLSEVADVYRSAHKDGKAPTAAVADKFGVSHSTAGRWVVEARKAGELGPAAGTKPGEATPAT